MLSDLVVRYIEEQFLTIASFYANKLKSLVVLHRSCCQSNDFFYLGGTK